MTIREVQLAELDVAKKFISICSNNGLNYVALGGTVLGAVRHNGFIPWDDDLDFGLVRQDYEKFKKIVANGGNFGFTVRDFTLNNNHDYPMKLESLGVEIMDESKEVPVLKHPWIDVFPLDGMPNGKLMRKLHGYHLLIRRALFKLSQLTVNVAVSNPNRTTTEKIIITLGKAIKLDHLLSERRMVKLLDASLRKYGTTGKKFWVNFMGAYKLHETFDQSVYGHSVPHKFEDINIKIPGKYDFYLTQMYGDYMQLPKEQDRNKHKTVVVDENAHRGLHEL